MEFTKMEQAVVEKTAAEAAEMQIRDLNDLQLMLIGGGNGAVIIA